MAGSPVETATVDCEVDCSSYFDHIDDLLDIPDVTCNVDNMESHFVFEEFKDFPSIWTPSDPFEVESNDVFSEKNSSHSACDLSDELSVPYEEIEQLEWLSVFVEDSFSAENSMTIDVSNVAPSTMVSPSSTQYHATSPVSVLESSGSSYAGEKFMPVSFKMETTLALPHSGRCVRARSERSRLPSFECESNVDIFNSTKSRKYATSVEHKKKKRIKLYDKAEVGDQNDDHNAYTPVEGEVRKCQHCEITKTPQWRAGPNGPKTLCNACGVRHKSGRLFPEYRPAASPTFVPSIHSNSHKKVLEMRVKTSCNISSSLTEDSLCKNLSID